MKFVVVGDVGQDAYHVGDEAMALAAADELSKRTGAEIVLPSRNPDQTHALHGRTAIPALRFPWPPAQRRHHLNLVRRAAAGDKDALPATDSVWTVIDAVRGSDGVLIAGGGNMNSLYGWLLYERCAMALIAHANAKPVVIAGQTFGPELTGYDRQVLHTMMEHASLIGAREPTSFRIGCELGFGTDKLVKVLDDATFLAEEPETTDNGTELPAETRELIRKPFIAATLGPEAWRDETRTLAQLAGVLDDLAQKAQMDILLIPHVGSQRLDGRDGDLESHRVVLAHSRSGRLRAAPVLAARKVAEITRRAELVLTNRYHPAVFALAAGVPVVSLSLDVYSDVRLHGAMGQWGLAAFALPLPSLASGGFAAATNEAWQRRREIRSNLEGLTQLRKNEFSTWWDAAANCLSGREPAERGPLQGIGLSDVPIVRTDSHWARDAAWLRPWFRSISSTVASAWTEGDDVRSERDELRRQLGAAEQERAHLLGSRSYRTTMALSRTAAHIRRLTGGAA
ncbi:polysaccharide pyruvyl transferase family protein [Paenarthrobacter sp. Z7-10]|uniref:polysaccharide pyruvyl transferase family protein n=1 Tax=Paenarthrobacter sp. Z7-10 TaxID=2787635 RepID=UPI0022A91587|nr:polysaccharide pyruvyl transferase family protein [Paenarthrobacter sp. Z7-10]MCZ2403923.1 polysaccharide pyruvyl transferase family protein [Paenarthrobacter sp. Z7-10]